MTVISILDMLDCVLPYLCALYSPDQKSRAPRSRKPTEMVKKEDIGEEPVTHERSGTKPPLEQTSRKRPRSGKKHAAADSEVEDNSICCYEE